MKLRQDQPNQTGLRHGLPIELPVALTIPQSRSQENSRSPDQAHDRPIDLTNERDKNNSQAIDIQISWTSGDPRERVEQNQADLHRDIPIELLFDLRSPKRSPNS